MSDEGFHEIQLSGKQLVFLFMSAVVLAVVIFLLGVDVGRGVPGAAGDTAVAVTAAAGDAAATGDAGAGETPAEPELSYHDLLVGGAAPASTASADPPAAAPPTTPPPPPVSEPTETPQPAAPVAAPPVAAGQWVLQMGAYSTRAVADDQVAKLKQLTVPAFVLAPTAGSSDKLFRVRVGPYADRAEAEQVKSRLERQGFTPLITR